MIRVLIVEDQQMVQETFRQYLSTVSDQYTIIGDAMIAEDAVAFCESGQVDLILMDVCTGNNSSGIHATEKIKKRFPKIKIIIVTSMPEMHFIKYAKKAGADSFWYKNLSKEEFLSILDRTVKGESVYPELSPSVKLGEIDSSKLTNREMEVLYWIVQGCTLPEIAEKLFISETTVRSHLENLKLKTGCKSKLQLAIMAVETGLVLPHYT